MTATTAFAPGKVVVCGEYAVTDGAPAIVAAVSIGVRAVYEPGDTLRIRTPGGDDRFVRAALAAAEAPSGTWTFTDVGGPALESKPGLGGSAAATVAAVHAAFAARGTPADRSTVHALADRVHREVQGSGSGIDVAASTWGGLIRFRRGEPIVALRPAAPPVVVWSGTSARTGPRLASYAAWPGRAAFVAESTAIVERFEDDPVSALDANRRLLEAMAEDAGLAYRTPALDRIVALAAACGGAAKASGAGGGDCAVALFRSAADEQVFRAACAADGFAVLSASLDAGVRIER